MQYKNCRSHFLKHKGFIGRFTGEIKNSFFPKVAANLYSHVNWDTRHAITLKTES